MGLINDQPDVRAQFLKQWSKFIPAIIAYGDSSSKRRVCSHVYDLDECGTSTNCSTILFFFFFFWLWQMKLQCK